jgi:hypothetical protein
MPHRSWMDLSSGHPLSRYKISPGHKNEKYLPDEQNVWMFSGCSLNSQMESAPSATYSCLRCQITDCDITGVNSSPDPASPAKSHPWRIHLFSARLAITRGRAGASRPDLYHSSHPPQDLPSVRRTDPVIGSVSYRFSKVNLSIFIELIAKVHGNRTHAAKRVSVCNLSANETHFDEI